MYGSYDNRGYAPRKPPVSEGEEIDVRIEAVGEKGDGVAKKDGFVLFVPNVQEGDEVRIKVTKVLRKVGFAEVIGQAQGPIGGSEPAPRSAAEEKAQEITEIASKAETMEDSEDFGEEAPAETAEEPEEVAEETPAEETAKDSEETVEEAAEEPEETPAEEATEDSEEEKKE